MFDNDAKKILTCYDMQNDAFNVNVSFVYNEIS